MRRLLPILALCFVAHAAASAAVTGYVMNSDGQPLPGAKIEMFSLESLDAARTRLLSTTPERKPLATGEADAKGKFTLDSPKDPVVLLRVSAKGYAPDMVRIERDEDVGAVALAPAEMKSGRITANGKPVAGAKVVWSGAGEVIATTDEQGRYSVPDPAKWAGGVTVIHPDYAVLDDSINRGFTPNPSVDRTLNAGVVLSGTVVAEDGKTPVSGAAVSIDGSPVATSGQDGTFTIPHAPAKWQTIAARSGSLAGTRARIASSPVVVIKLAKAASLTGSLRDSKTQTPIAGADIRLRALMRIDAGQSWSAFTDAKGNYAINGIIPGAYQVVATRPGYSIAQVSVSLAANDRINKPLSGSQLARVSGTIVDEQKRPVPAARVASQSLSRGDGPMMMMGGRATAAGVSAPDGSFITRADGDTDIQVEATKKGYPPAKSSKLRLAPGERKSGIVLTIPSGVAVTGRVLDRNGKPLAGVSVAALEATSFSVQMMRRVVLGGIRERKDDLVKTANDGTFSIRVKEGSFDFGFKREGFAAKSVRAVQVNATTKPLEITLDPGVEISGRVTRNGTGIDGVRIMAMGESDNASAETAADGSFRLTDLSPGQMILNATKEDEFIQQIRPVTAPAADITIEIPAGVRVSGRVVDKNTRQPVTAFEAGVSTPRGGGGMVFMMPPALRHFTSDDGTFVLDNVPPGQTHIVVNAPGYTTARVPNVNIEEGKSIADLVVEMDRGVRVTGKVTGPDGSALSGVSVRLDMMGGRMMRPGAMQNQGAVTDAGGEYSLDAVEAGEKTLVFTRSGYLTAQKSATLSGSETRVDAQLSTGTRVSGIVVTDAGVPVADASVSARSAADTNGRGTQTDANGNFEFEGLAPGRYTFSSSKNGYADGRLRDFDITAGAPPRIVLTRGGVVYGRVSGLSADDLQRATVSVQSPNGFASAPVDASGSFRVEGAPVGTVRISANISGGMVGGKSSTVQSVQVDAGSQVEVNISFKTGTVVRGRVTRNGRPVDSAMVAFFPKEAQAQTSARTSTNSAGEYEVSGLDDAMYNVQVVDIQRSAPFSTTYQVRGSGTFDVEMKAAPLRGRVMDADGNAIADAMVELREKGGDGGMRMSRAAQTDASGTFLVDNVAPGSYSVSAEKQGYGTRVVETSVGDNGGDVQITLAKNAGVTLRIVDARDGRLLNARVHVTNAQSATIYDSPFFGAGSAQPITVPLESGSYTATVMAMGYAPQTVTLTSPSSPTIGMTPGGSIVIQSKGNGLRRAKLMTADGREYARGGFGPAIFMVDPSPGATVLNNIAPGTYTLQILGDGSEVAASAPVTVAEGQKATVSL